MARKYKKKIEKKYDLNNLERAIRDVRSKQLTIGKAAKNYSIPKSTIYDHLKKEVLVQPKSGRKSVFSEAQEKELAEHIIKCSKLFYGLTVEAVRKTAYKFAEKNKLNHKFNKNSQKDTKPKKDEKTKKKQNKENKQTQNEYYCIFCAGKYEEPPTEEWIMCYGCNLWAHEECSDGESTSKGFLCDLCRD